MRPRPVKTAGRTHSNRYWVERGNLEESGPYFESCIALCDLAPEDTWETRGDNLGCMAQVANMSNDYKTAINYAAESLAVFEVHGQNTWRLAQAYNELSEAYIAARRYEEAVNQADLSINAYWSLPTYDPPDWPRMNKGVSLCNLGRLDEAWDVLESYLEFRENTFGKNDTESFK